MKAGLSYFSFSRVPKRLEKLLEFYKKIDASKDTFNLIQGDHEVSVITNQKYAKEVQKLIGRSNLRSRESGLVSISMTLSKDFSYTPGMIYAITKKLYWSRINIFELLTTATDLAMLFQQKDASRAYDAIYELSKKAY